MSVGQFDALLAILETNIKYTTNFRELCVQAANSALCYKTKWINMSDGILNFAVRMYGGFELSKYLSNACYGCEKFQSKFFNDSKNSKNVNMIDTM